MSKKSKSNKTKPMKTDNPKNEGEPASISEKGAPKGGLSIMAGVPRVISLLVLLAVVLLISVLFFRVMANFLVPLFLAAVLTVVFKPLHTLLVDRFPGRRRLTALMATSLITLLVLVPTAWLGWKAFVETSEVVSAVLSEDAPERIGKQIEGQATEWKHWYDEMFSSHAEVDEEEKVDEKEKAAEKEAENKEETEDEKEFDFKEAIIKISQYTGQHVVKIGLVGVQALFTFAFGLGVMIFALYYFFADGPEMLETLMHLSPLDDDYERELLQQFATVSRAVVLATVITAVVQGLLAGVGYYALTFVPNPPAQAVAADVVEGDVMPPIAGPRLAIEEKGPVETIRLPVFLLTVLTMLLAIVPFIGAMAIWGPVTVWVFFMVPGGHWPAIAMALFGFIVISSIDNVIKPYVLSGQSNLHPLLALLSVLGGVQLLGPIGILVGPILVAFMQALLGMLRKELDKMHAEAAV